MPVLLLVGLGLLLVVLVWPRFVAPFGDSHDGRNGATWAAGSRALREEGPLGSKLGAKAFDGAIYANHPPLILVEAAASETIFGEVTWASRLPSLLSTLASIALLYLVISDLGIRPGAAIAGIAMAFITPMVLVYGSMLDTPMTSLALGAALLYVVQRSLSGRPLASTVMAIIAATACLSSWEATLMAWIGAVVLVAWSRRRQVPGQRSAIPGMALAIGAGIGTSLTVLWTVWAYGSISGIHDALVMRTSDTLGATRLGALQNQLTWTWSLFGLSLAGLVLAAFAAIVDGPRRSLLSLALTTTLLYPVLLYNGAYFHSYWNYWFVLPSVLGLAWGVDRFIAWAHGREFPGPAIFASVGLVVAVTIGSGATRTTSAGIDEEVGRQAGFAVAAAHFDPGQGLVSDVGNTYNPRWLTYASRLPHMHLTTFAGLRAVAATHPESMVLVSSACQPGGEATELCQRIWANLPAGTTTYGNGPRWTVLTALAAEGAAASTNSVADGGG